MSAEEQAELSLKPGADDVFLYGQGVDVTATVNERTNGRGIDVTHDGVGKDAFGASLASIKALGPVPLF